MQDSRQPKAIRRLVKMRKICLVFAAMLLCLVSCKEKMTRIPPEDVPLYGAKRLILKETGPGGYKLTYSTSTDVDQLVEFYKEQMTLFHWQLTADIEDAAGGRMFYFSKERRFLNLHIMPLEEGIGCYFIISETGG